MAATQLLLASSSPRRIEILRLLRINFIARASQVHEVARREETPGQFAGRMAKEKARKAIKNRKSADPKFVLAADTIVYLPGPRPVIFGKPRNKKEAGQFLHVLAGKAHEVLTAIALVQIFDNGLETWLERIVRSRVYFRRLGKVEIENYLHTHDWRDKAGGYGIQSDGAFLIDTIEGSYSNIVGMPVEELLEAFVACKFPGWWSAWKKTLG